MEPTVALPLLAGAIALVVTVIVASRRNCLPRSIARQAEEFRTAAEKERARASVSVLADEIRRRGGRIDPYGRVLFPGDKVFRDGKLVDPDDDNS